MIKIIYNWITSVGDLCLVGGTWTENGTASSPIILQFILAVASINSVSILLSLSLASVCEGMKDQRELHLVWGLTDWESPGWKNDRTYLTVLLNRESSDVWLEFSSCSSSSVWSAMYWPSKSNSDVLLSHWKLCSILWFMYFLRSSMS